MKVILLKDVPKIGRKNDIKDVSDGHALNFLIPRGFAVKATPLEVKKLEAQKAMHDAERQVQEELLAKSIEGLSTITVTIAEKANDKGHLFEGIHKERLAEEIKKSSRIEIKPEFIDLDKPIKEIGEFLVPIEAHGKKGKVRVIIEKENF